MKKLSVTKLKNVRVEAARPKLAKRSGTRHCGRTRHCGSLRHCGTASTRSE